MIYRILNERDISSITNLKCESSVGNSKIHNLISMLRDIGVPHDKFVVAIGAFIDEPFSTLVGLAYGYIVPKHTLLIQYVYVEPEYRHKQVGKTLVSTLEQCSNCSVSQVFYAANLTPFYSGLNYFDGNVKVAIKFIN